MTSADSLSLILRRLDEIKRKLDRMMEELRTPTATKLEPKIDKKVVKLKPRLRHL
jgi:hypothetical protein